VKSDTSRDPIPLPPRCCLRRAYSIPILKWRTGPFAKLSVNRVSFVDWLRIIREMLVMQKTFDLLLVYCDCRQTIHKPRIL
jgi:hypothetical protein